MPNAKLKFRNSLADSPSQSPLVALPGAGSLAYTGRVPAAVVTGESPIDNGEHPRLLWTLTDYGNQIPTVASVRAKIAANSLLLNRIEEGITYLDARYATAPGAFGGQILQEIAFGYGFLAQLFAAGSITGLTPDHTAAEYGAKCVACSMQYVDDASPPGYLQEAYYSGFIATFPFDWAYDYFSSSDRATYAAFLKASEATGHWMMGVNNEAAAFQNGAIAMAHYAIQNASAVAKEGYDDAFWDGIRNNFSGIVFPDLTGTVASWSAHGGNTDTAVTEGFNYFQYTNDGGLIASECHRTAHGLSKAGFYDTDSLAQYLYAPRFFTYMFLPHGIASGSYNSGITPGFWRSNYSVTWREGLDANNLLHQIPAMTAGILGFLDSDMAGLSMWLQRERTVMTTLAGNGGQAGTAGYVMWMIRAIVSDESIASITPTDLGLPLSYNFPTGYNVYRESLTDQSSGHALVTFNTVEFTTAVARGRQPTQLLGHFTVNRKGPQIIIRGSHSHGGPSHGYCNRMAFPRSDRVIFIGTSTDDLGDIRGSLGSSAVNATFFQQDTEPDFRGTTRFHNLSGSRDVDYAYLDMTRGYSTDSTDDDWNPARVTRAQVDFVNFRGASAGDPVRIVRMDRWGLIAAGTYEPIYLMNYAAEPIVTGGSAEAAGPSRQGTTHGFKQYGAATTATATNTVGNYDGKTVTTILAPSSRTVIKLGGPNEAGFKWNIAAVDDPTANSCESMDYYGVRTNPINSLSNLLGSVKDYGPTCLNAPDIGFYGIEVRDDSGATSGYFLLCHEVGDSTMTPSTVTNWSGTLACARIGNRAAAFRTDSAINATSGTIIASTTGTDYRVLFADFNPASTRTITYGSNITNMSIVGGAAVPSGGTVVVDDVGGDFYLEFDVTSAGSGANNTITVS